MEKNRIKGANKMTTEKIWKLKQSEFDEFISIAERRGRQKILEKLKNLDMTGFNYQSVSGLYIKGMNDMKEFILENLKEQGKQ